MSKTIAIWALSGVVVVSAGYFFINYSKNNSAGSKEISAEVLPFKGEQPDLKPELQPIGGKVLFADLIKQSGSHKCTISQNINNAVNTGVVYMGDGVMRGEINTKTGGMSIDSNFIILKDYAYTWSSAMPGTGFKVKVPKEAGGAASAGIQSIFNAQQVENYNCQNWTIDKSKFEIPSGVTFQEYAVPVK